MHVRISASLALVVAAAGAAPRVSAGDKELLDTLLENRAITAEQHAELSGAGAANPDASAAEVSVGPGGLVVQSADGDFSIDIGVRLHADWVRHSGETAVTQATDGTSVRRARIELGGRFDADWRWAAEADFADNDVSVKDFWLAYRGLPGVVLTAGHQKQPYSLALEMSSNDIPFVERSIDNALVAPLVDRALGVRADSSGERWFAAAGVFGESVSPRDEGDEGWATVGRFVFAPIVEDERVVHLGLRAAYRELPVDSTLRLRDETTAFSNLHVVDTGPLTGISAVTLLGPEAAAAVGPLWLAAEYNAAAVDFAAAPDVDLDSWHVAATWTLGGESRAAAYDLRAGEFKRLAAAQSYRRGQGGGTWELAARYAAIDLNDDALVGGSEETLTLGANWYANENVRLMLDWTRVVDTDASNAMRDAAEGLDVFTMRVQYAF